MPRRARVRAAQTASLTGLAALVLAAPAAAQRPEFAAEPLLHDGEAGHVRVHYVTSSDDAVPAADENGDGTPDYVEEVAALAELAWDDLVARGFRPPETDTGLVDGDDGGDGRFDIYLLDLIAADGNYVAEACTPAPVHCAGYFAMENDLADFGYPSVTDGISVLTSHELFHAVQAAYVPGMEITWSEGTAVWNEEQTFPEQTDYEQLVAYFLEKPHRPFDRGGGGFGDLYPYGTALLPTFLDERFGDGVVRRVWEACEAAGEGADFLDAIDLVMGEEGGSLEEAWIEFSRWNLFTAGRADPERAYRAGADLVSVATEDGLTVQGTASTTVEGFSSRYLPVAVAGEGLQIAVQVDDAAVAAFFPQDGEGALGQPIELERDDGGALAALLPAEGRGILALTSIRRGGLPRDATIEIAVAPPDSGGGDDEDHNGCQAARSSSGGRLPGTTVMLLAAAALFLARRGRARPRPRRCTR